MSFLSGLQIETGKILVQLALGENPDIAPDGCNVYRTHSEMIERESVCTIAACSKSQVSSSKSQAASHKI